MSPKYSIGVDVGSGSVRAGVVSSDGSVVVQSVRDIEIRKGAHGHVEQSSVDIWEGVVEVVSEVVRRSCDEHNVAQEDIVGIGFDATCSMVVTHKDVTKTVSVASDEDPKWDIIMWMDHRAAKQTKEINATQHPVLQYVGGAVSPEMQMPKLKWLAENKSEGWWGSVGLIFELPDWLVWKATNSEIRSMCSTVCKWNYVNDDSFTGWDESYLKEIGFTSDITARIGTTVSQIGDKCGSLTAPTKAAFGLTSETISVPASLIDAHAGGLSLCSHGEKKVAIIAGTSTCFMALHPNKNMINGVWGPYKDAMVPGMWLHEGGMSATGALLDFIVDSHPAKPAAETQATTEGVSLQHFLETKYGSPEEALQALTTREIHLFPDFLGNRSPIGDSTLKGMVSGLILDGSVEELALLYCAAVVSLAYGVNHVASVLEDGGYRNLEAFVVCGGLSRSTLFTVSLASVSGKRVEVAPGGDAMLLGCAVSAFAAAKVYPSLQDAQAALAPHTSLVDPLEEACCALHKKRFAVFLEMLKDQQKYRSMMN